MTRRIGFAGEERRSFRHGLDRAGEAEIGQRSHEIGTEATGAGQPVPLLGGKAQILQIIQRLFQTGGQQEIPLRRQATHEQLERGRFVHAFGVISLEHGELIQIGQQRAVGKGHGDA